MYTCWRCMERDAEPGALCDTCHSSEDRKQRRWGGKSRRRSSTHDRTHERYIVSYEEADMDAMAYRDWMNRQ